MVLTLFLMKRMSLKLLKQRISIPSPDRLWFVADGFRKGLTLEEVFEFSKIDPWFLVQIKDIVNEEINLEKSTLNELDFDDL